MNIDKMQAGRELDALVAVKILGWRWMKYPAPNMGDGTWLTLIAPPDAPGRIPVCNGYDRAWLPSDANAKRFSGWDRSSYWDDDGATCHCGLPHYSTDIAVAWQVVEKLREQYGITIISHAENPEGEDWTWRVSFIPKMAYHSNSTTAPLAICRAALKAQED